MKKQRGNNSCLRQSGRKTNLYRFFYIKKQLHVWSILFKAMLDEKAVFFLSVFASLNPTFYLWQIMTSTKELA